MSLGKTSLERLCTCHPDLQRLVRDVSQRIDEGELAAAGISDITVLCGHRGKAEQDAAFAKGTSRLQWPNSWHNKTPARAVDIAPYPLDWGDEESFQVLRGYVLARAAALGVRISVIPWDMPHYQLKNDAP